MMGLGMTMNCLELNGVKPRKCLVFNREASRNTFC